MVIAMTGMTGAPKLQGAGYVWPNKASEPSDGPWQAYSYLSWDVYASVRATTEKLVPWFAGEE